MRGNFWLVCLVAACSGGGRGDDVPDDLDVISTGPASGTIMGTPFTVGTRFMSVSSGDLFAVTADTVSGGLHVFDAEFGEIDGRFDGALCFSN